MLHKHSMSFISGMIIILYFLFAGVLLYRGFGLKILSQFGITTNSTNPWNLALYTITVVSVLIFLITPFIRGFFYSMETKQLISEQESKEVAKCVVISSLIIAIVGVIIAFAYAHFNGITDLKALFARWKDFFPFAVAQPGTYIFISSLFFYYWEICFSLRLGSKLYFYFHKNKS